MYKEVGFILILALTSYSAVAQPAKEYCYEGECFDSLARAENRMRQASSVYGHLLRQKSSRQTSNTSSTNPTWTVYYEVPDQPPEQVWAPGYVVSGWTSNEGICSPTGDPVYGYYCSDGDEAAINFLQYFIDRHPSCTFNNHGFIGDHAEPFSRSTPYSSKYGIIDFLESSLESRRRFVYDIWCPGWGRPDPDVREFHIYKHQTYSCSNGFSPIRGVWHEQNLGGNPSVNIDRPDRCQTSYSRNITIKLKQTNSCPANGNPCHPATGDKSRTERDFEFSGISFNRYYHSLRQASAIPAFAPGWTHTFSDRVASGRIAGYYVVREDGYVEYFKRVASTQKYVSSESKRKILYVDTHGYRLVGENGAAKYFDAQGRLIHIDNSAIGGESVSLIYEIGFLQRAVDSKGREVSFQYEEGRLSSVVLPDATLIDYQFDDAGNLTNVVYQGGLEKSYHYNEAGLSDSGDPHGLTGITSEAGDRYASFAYDEFGRVVASRLHKDAASYADETTLSYVDSTHVDVVAPSGEARTYTIATDGVYRRIVGISDSRGETANIYGGGALQQSTDRSGVATVYTYTDDYLSSRTVGEGTDEATRVVFVRDDEYRLLAEEFQEKQAGDFRSVFRKSRTYNTRGQALTETRADPGAGATRTTTTTYCEQADITAGACPLLGLVTSIDGPRADVNDLTTYIYYPADHADCAAAPTACPWRKGDLWKVTNALGQVTETLRYDGAGRPLSVKDANGVVTDMEYHPRGWLTARKVRGPDNDTEADDRITRIDYWPTGLVQRVTQPDGAFTEYDYDAAHRLTTIRDNAGNTITYTLDNAGNRIAEDTRDSAGTLRQTLSRVYDQLGQLATQADAGDNPTDYTYDANGNRKTITDALGRETLNDYDPLNRLVRTLQDVGGIEAETRYEYDALDHLTKVVDPKGLETDYTYNAFGDLLQLDSPDTGATTYTYDSAGNRTGQVDARGQASTYTYDALNRLTGIAYTGAADLDTTYTYDVTQPGCAADETFSAGRLTAMSDASGSTRYCYDRFGQLVRKLQVTNGQTFTLRYAYTKAGQLSSLTYPDGSVADYVRDAQGRVTEVGVTSLGGAREVLLSGAEYYPFGPAAGWSYGNGRTLSRVHDLDYRPQSMHDPATGGLDFGYSYDPVGNLSALHSADLAEPPRASFDYDALSRLTAFRDGAVGAAIESYGYDATGNRTSFANASGSQAYAYPAASHRLTAVAGEPRSYDAAGNTNAIGTAKEFVYSAANRMSQVKQGGVVAMHYVYNGKGEQVRKHLGAHDITTVFDEAGRWLGDYDATGTPLQQAIWLDDLPVGLLVGSAGANRLHYMQPDHLGTPRAVIDPTRNVAIWNWDLASEAFGNSPPNQDPDGDGVDFVFDMRFPGQRHDAASGLNYNYFRDYDPATGRYVESDPIGLMGGLSTYGYVSGSPMSASDPVGLAGTTADTWCRQHPAACAAIFGGGGAVAVTPKSDVMPRPETSSNDKCKGCSEVYPEYDLCSEMSRYYPYSSAAHALLDFPRGSKPRPPMPATGGLCAQRGSHQTVFLNGSYIGSIFSCRCCIDTGGGAVISEIWGNNSGR